MDTIEGISAAIQATNASQAQVKVMKSADRQYEAVMANLLSGIEAAPRVPEQTGHVLNVAA